MKNDEIRALSVEELEDAIVEQQVSLQKLRFSHAVSPIENPMVIRNARRLVARLKTELTVKLRAKDEVTKA